MKKRELISLGFNLAIAVLSIICIVLYKEELINFKYYAVLSNYLALIASLLMIIFLLIKKDLNLVPYPVLLLKYISAVSLTLTIIVVLTVLIPLDYGISDYGTGFFLNMLSGSSLFRHLLVPVLTIVSFIFFEGDRRLNKRKTMSIPIAYTAIYTVIILVLVITEKIMSPYPFLDILYMPVYSTIIYFVLIGGVDYFLAKYLLLFNQMKAPRVKLKR